MTLQLVTRHTIWPHCRGGQSKPHITSRMQKIPCHSAMPNQAVVLCSCRGKCTASCHRQVAQVFTSSSWIEIKKNISARSDLAATCNISIYSKRGQRNPPPRALPSEAGLYRGKCFATDSRKLDPLGLRACVQLTSRERCAREGSRMAGSGSS